MFAFATKRKRAHTNWGRNSKRPATAGTSCLSVINETATFFSELKSYLATNHSVNDAAKPLWIDNFMLHWNRNKSQFPKSNKERIPKLIPLHYFGLPSPQQNFQGSGPWRSAAEKDQSSRQWIDRAPSTRARAKHFNLQGFKDPLLRPWFVWVTECSIWVKFVKSWKPGYDYRHQPLLCTQIKRAFLANKSVRYSLIKYAASECTLYGNFIII